MPITRRLSKPAVESGITIFKGTETGSYEAKFKKFHRNKQGGFFFTIKDSPQEVVRYDVVTDTGKIIPGSFPWDFTDYRIKSALGAFGTPARIVAEAARKFNPDQILERLEPQIIQKGLFVHVYVSDKSGGYIAGISPADNTYAAKFERFITRDASDKPIHQVKQSTFIIQKGPQAGQQRTTSRDKTMVAFVIQSGQNEGATALFSLEYALERVSGRQYNLDESKLPGKQFIHFFGTQRVLLDKLDFSKFADPDNLLPELEKMILQKAVNVIIVVENGWVKSFSASPVGEDVTLDLEASSPPRKKLKAPSSAETEVLSKLSAKKPKEALPSPHVGTLMMVVNNHTGKTVFDLKSATLKLTNTWSNLLKKLPAKSYQLPPDVNKWSTAKIKDVLADLGYNTIADRIKE